MSRRDVEEVGIRPYARLLTMLGEQLIKNDRVALVELLKNSYDADASLARVTFAAFEEDLRAREGSTIVLADNGDGMTDTVVRHHWLNPATDIKAERKAISPKTSKNRIIQGEKGIGRFAIFKLGKTASIVTRARGGDSELLIEYDLSFLEPEEDGADRERLKTELPVKPRFLDEIRVQLTEREPEVFDGVDKRGLRSTHGTRIEIGSLRSDWSGRLAKKAFDDVARLQPLVPARDFQTPATSEEFKVEFWNDNEELPFSTGFAGRLQELFDERTVLKVDGLFSGKTGEFVLEIDGELTTIGIDDPALAGLQVHKSYFGQPKDSPRGTADLACGPFSFSFFVFDLSATCPAQYRLDVDEKGLVKEHRIYLYRDGIRVLPYGDPQDDWLQLDVIRGTQGASRVLGNDQTVGFVHITHEDNPQLRDKTNREGLLDAGDAYGDFVAVLQAIIAYIRAKPYARYVDGNRRAGEAAARQRAEIAEELKALEENPILPNTLKASVRSLVRSYLAEREFMAMRAERTEDLAGVGLSVESASHDILAAGGQALNVARSISAYVKEYLSLDAELNRQADTLVELLSFVTSRLNDVQGLFVSTRQRRKNLDVADFAERVGRMFRYALSESEIQYSVTETSGSLQVKSTEAALLQALVNMVDNAIYWLNFSKGDKRIVVQVDALARQMVVADNGPGVDVVDEPFIFEPFYSGKGVEGKGLGLYIARQVGIRNGFDVALADRSLVLPGANFVISFGEQKW